MNLQKKQYFFWFWARQGLILTPTYVHLHWRIRAM